MRRTNAKWIFVTLFAIGLSGLPAQTILNVKEKSGTLTPFILGAIQKLSFNSEGIKVSRKGGNSSNFAWMNVRYLNFSEITYIGNVSKEENSNMSLYPNPVKDRLQVRYETFSEENVIIQLIDIQGKVICTQNSKSTLGINYVNINSDTFQNGIYLCKLQTGNRVEIKKFIKY